MFLKKIELKNYRKFEKKELEFKRQIIVILGENAAGKTTVLEAINVLGTTKTPKNSDLTESVKIGEEFFCVSGSVNDGNDDKKLFVSYSNGNKKAMVNGRICKKISDYIKSFFVVYFQPIDALKYSLSSQNRRTLFDSFFCQISDAYLTELMSYKRLLKEKNALLKLEDFKDLRQKRILLEMINSKMINPIKKIEEERKKWIQKINNKISEIHHFFSSEENAKINLISNIDDPNKKLSDSLNNDLIAKTSTVGPHKDDYEFLINEKNVSDFCSQGQQKSFVLSLKIAMLELLSIEKKTAPILILDDAFGDLDINRQNAIFEIVGEKYQLFISTTSLKQINESIIKKSQIIEIKKGAGFNE